MRRLAVAVGAVAVLAVGGVAFAQTTGDGRIYACVNDGDGAVRVQDGSDATCSRGWSPLSWSQQGPQGERGEPGEKGEQGDPGGPGVKIVLASRTVTVPGGTRTPVYRSECVQWVLGTCVSHEQVLDHWNEVPGTVTGVAPCPQGTQSMGDGKAEGVTPGVSATAQERVGYTGWRATFSNQSPGEGTGRVEVRCVEVAEVTTVTP
jgi:hypothetical protein